MLSFFLGLHLYASQVYRSNLMLGRYVATAFDMAGASSVNDPHFTMLPSKKHAIMPIISPAPLCRKAILA